MTFVAVYRIGHGRAFVGPIHVLAGHTDPLDPVTACGLTLPHGDSLYGPDRDEFHEPRCGDCFRLPLDIPCEYCGALAGEPCNYDCLSTEEIR